MEREDLWIKPHIHLIKIKSHFSGTHFDDKFPTFGMASCITVPAQIFAWPGFAKFLSEIISGILIRCLNLILWHAANWQHYTMRTPFLDVHFQPSSQWNFSEPVERHRFLKSYYITLHVWFHRKINTIMKSWNSWSWWSLEVGTPPLDKPYHVTSLAKKVVNSLVFGMSMLHDKSSWYLQSNLKDVIWFLS